MMHMLAQKVVYRLLPSARFEEADLVTKLSVLAGYVGLVMGLCLATYYLVERPCRRLFKKVVTRKPVRHGLSGSVNL